MTAVVVPQLSISMEEAKVGRWLVENGDAVAAGQILVEIETDKATVEIEAPAAGQLRIIAGEGAIVPVEGTLADVEEAVPKDANGAAPAAVPVAVSSAAAPARDEAGPQQEPIASPAARRLARERGVELASLSG